MSNPSSGLRVAINDAISRRGLSGTATAVTLIELALRQAGHEVVRVSPHHRHANKVSNAIKSTWWDFVAFARAANDADVLVFPCNYGTAGRSGRPTVLWIQDTMSLDAPGRFDPLFALYTRLTFGPSARRASTVVTASQDARRRIVRRWPELLGTTEVVPWPSQAPQCTARPRTPTRLDVLMVGATEPHKQHVIGVQAVSLLRKSTGRAISLSLYGPPGRAEEDVRQALASADPEGSWARRLVSAPQDQLEEAYRTSWILLQPSSDEGFCLPLIESASFALPAVHTGAGSMSEVHPYGDAGTGTAAGLAAAMAKLLDERNYAIASERALEVATRWGPDDFSAALDALVRRTAAQGPAQ